MIYRIKLASEQIYIIDTEKELCWPEGCPELQTKMWPKMNPEHPDFPGTVLSKSNNC